MLKFSNCFVTDCRQFGFKKRSGCSDAIYAARSVVENYIHGGSSVNILALDISKAFDKVNHFALLTKLLRRNAPLALVKLLANWLPFCVTCVKWSGMYSSPFALKVGVRQGSVLAPILFAVYVDDIIALCVKGQLGEIILYADDILLLSRFVWHLQLLFNIIENALADLDLQLNCTKSCGIRVGKRRHSDNCANICNRDGVAIKWQQEMRYLGIHLLSANVFKCSFSIAKRRFCSAANAVFSKVCLHVNEDVTLHLLKTKCLPLLLYGTEACMVAKRDLQSLDFVVTRFLMKLFQSTNRTFIEECMYYFGFVLPSELIKLRQERFVKRCAQCDTALIKLYNY